MFERVRDAVGDLEVISRALDPGRLDGRAAGALVELAARGERLCAAIKALAARRVDETNAWRETGHRSAAHWVAHTTGETVGAAGRALETARALDVLPETDAAFRAGLLSQTQAAEITSAADADPTAEASLLATAGSTSVKGCREVRAGARGRRRRLGASPSHWSTGPRVDRSGRHVPPGSAPRARRRRPVQLLLEDPHRPHFS